MNIVVICLAIVAFLPILLAWVSSSCRYQQLGTFDNKTPRLQTLELTGIGHRAYAAQQNSWEALMLFFAALLALTIAGVDLMTIKNLCVVFVVARISYAICYLVNQDILRSLVFMVAWGICLYFFYLAIVA